MDKCEPINRHHLDRKMCFIIYESSQMITDLCEPRKYTILKVGDKIYISIGHDYDRDLIKLDKLQHRVIGKWIKKDRKYELRFTALLSTKANPDCDSRNEYWCENFGEYLEAVGHAEAGLLKLHDKIIDAKVLVYFKSHDEDYARVEHWQTLKYWSDYSEYEEEEQDYNSEFSFRKTENDSKFSRVRKDKEDIKHIKEIDLSAMYEDKRPSLMDIKMNRKKREDLAKSNLIGELSEAKPIPRDIDHGLQNEIGFYDSRVFSETILPPNKNKVKKDDHRTVKSKVVARKVEDYEDDSSIHIDQKEFLKMKNTAKPVGKVYGGIKKGDCATCR